MKIGTKKLIILGLSVLLIGAVLYIAAPAPATLLSGSVMDIEGGREVNGKWVEGWWVYTIVIDSTDSYLSFTLKDLEEPHPTDSDAEIKSAGTAKVVLERYTPYMISYPINKAYYGLPQSGWSMMQATSADAYYRVMGFASTVCPYKVSLYRNGSLVDSKIGVAGDPTSVSWATMGFSVGTAPYNAVIKDVGLMSKGLSIPVVDLSVDYTPTGYTRVYSVTDHKAKLDETLPVFNNIFVGEWNYQGLWNDFLYNLSESPGITLFGADDRYRLKGMPSNVGLIDISKPSDGELWSKVNPPFPGDYEYAGGVRTEATGLIVAATRPDYTSATITLRVRSELVDSWVWHEPQGIPDILPIDKVSATGASTAVATIKVKNVGNENDTFVVSVQPTNAWCSGVSPREQNIDVGKTGTFYATLDTQDVAQFESEQVFVKATAMGSGETDTAYFTLEIEPKPEPNGDDGVGRVSGKVVDSETKDGISGVRAVVGGKMADSDSSGNFLVDGVPVGVWMLTISADEYEGWQTDVSVSKDATTNIGTIELIRVAEGGSWLDEFGIIIAIGVAGALAAVFGVWWLRRK